MKKQNIARRNYDRFRFHTAHWGGEFLPSYIDIKNLFVVFTDSSDIDYANSLLGGLLGMVL